MFTVILTSFRDAKNLNGTKCSIARWQPIWSDMPEFPLDIKPIYNGKTLGEWNGKDLFRQNYEKILKNKEKDLINLFCNVNSELSGPIVLCCWCTLDRQKSEKLFCHRILVGYWIEEHFPYARVIYADGAEKPIWNK